MGGLSELLGEGGPSVKVGCPGNKKMCGAGTVPYFLDPYDYFSQEEVRAWQKEGAQNGNISHRWC